MGTIHAFNPSKPFVITALITLMAGSTIGSIWMMTTYGVILPAELAHTVHLHKLLQIDGFLTMIIMGVGYLIVPRFRNITIPSVKLVYVSYGLVLVPVIFSVIVSSSTLESSIYFIMSSLASFCRLLGVGIFCFLIMLTIRKSPKLLRLADYFISLSVSLITILAFSEILNYDVLTQNIQLWMMFPIIMIFGIQYKTLPSFIGFIWPRKIPSFMSALFLTISLGLGITSSLFQNTMLLEIMFRIAIFGGVACFTWALNIFTGFDTSNILKLSQGEKKARYKFTLAIAKLSFSLLIIGCVLSILSVLFSGNFVIYDMWIHITAIGFIGLTVAMYLPLMLSPILGRPVRFIYISKLPIWLILISLVIRTVGDIYVQHTSNSDGSYSQLLASALSLSGWLVVAAILSFMFMVHRSINMPAKIYSQDETTPL
ncbi:MAG TPA: hypothetical protein VF248_03320 [Nitrososphaeraceae archaeon]